VDAQHTPIVGITMGDAAGIGPEITIKALGDTEMYSICRPLVIGDAKILERANGIVHGQLSIERISHPSDARFVLGTVDCIDLDLLPADLPFGQISAAAGDAAFRFVERAIELAKNNDIDAICTAPLNKEA
jgi:4-hydroxy-L-threonine phosphate dehydrogenase PdxA